METEGETGRPPQKRSAFAAGFEGAMGGCLGILVFLVVLVLLVGYCATRSH